MLALSPLLLPLHILWWVVYAFVEAVQAWWESFRFGVTSTLGFWYRSVYRPARYGSVWDDVDENGRPRAWLSKRGSGGGPDVTDR